MNVLSIILLAIGILIRAALYYPPAMFQIDPDAVVAGICAFRIEHGQYPLFFSRRQSFERRQLLSYRRILPSVRTGEDRFSINRPNVGSAVSRFYTALPAGMPWTEIWLHTFLFAIVPPEQFMTVTYPPWGYGEIVASCAATLWLATLWRREGLLWQRVCFGLSVGIGLWFSFQTLMIVLPAIILDCLTAPSVHAERVGTEYRRRGGGCAASRPCKR